MSLFSRDILLIISHLKYWSVLVVLWSSETANHLSNAGREFCSTTTKATMLDITTFIFAKKK